MRTVPSRVRNEIDKETETSLHMSLMGLAGLRLVLIRERVLGPDEVLAAAIEVLSWRSRIVTEGFASTQGRVLGVTVILMVWSSGLCLLRPKSKGPICLMESKF